MRRTPRHSLLAVAALVSAADMATAGTPLGTTVTNQGRLEQNGSAVNGACDFQFSLWDEATAGNPIGPTLIFDGAGGNPPPVALANGLFTVGLEFGAGGFNGEARWLEIAVRSPAGGGLW